MCRYTGNGMPRCRYSHSVFRMGLLQCNLESAWTGLSPTAKNDTRTCEGASGSAVTSRRPTTSVGFGRERFDSICSRESESVYKKSKSG